MDFDFVLVLVLVTLGSFAFSALSFFNEHNFVAVLSQWMKVKTALRVVGAFVYLCYGISVALLVALTIKLFPVWSFMFTS